MASYVMETKTSSLEIFEHYDGWTYRFHGDTFTYTQAGFDSPEAAFEATKQNDWIKLSTRPIRIVVTDEVKRRLGLESEKEVRSAIPGCDLIAIPWNVNASQRALGSWRR